MSKRKSLKDQVRELSYTTPDGRELLEIKEIVDIALKIRFPMLSGKGRKGAVGGPQTAQRRGRNVGVPAQVKVQPSGSQAQSVSAAAGGGSGETEG